MILPILPIVRHPEMLTKSDNLRIVLLCGPSRSSRVMYHFLAKGFHLVRVIEETKPSGLRLLARRLKKLGLVTVTGQVAFMLLGKLRQRFSEPRVRALLMKFELDDSAIPAEFVARVDSVNNQSTVDLLKSLAPDVVVVNGTRIISERVLTTITCPFVNTHMGTTPRYRGVHGAYWALAENDKANCGVTVHLVDPGIDTGAVLYQARITPEPVDNFDTYTIYQLHAAIPLMKAALDDIRSGRLHPIPGVGPSRLWSHPTIWTYLHRWLTMGVK